jgi:hypothetical protein
MASRKGGSYPDWKALSSRYSVPINADVFIMSATDYSPLK